MAKRLQPRTTLTVRIKMPLKRWIMRQARNHDITPSAYTESVLQGHMWRALNQEMRQREQQQ